MTPQLKQQLTNLPTEPGIYRYYDQQNNLLYVGKAKNLRNRVKSYFVDRQTSPKTKILVSQIDHLETITVASEIDALILEANLIKQYQPPYNIILKDDKSHIYIKITTYQEFPNISTCRQTDMAADTKALYFGPYPSGRVVRQTLRYLRKVFPYLAHRPPVAPGRRRAGQSFFYYNLNLGQVKPNEVWDKTLYRRQVFQLVHLLEGKRLNLLQELTKDMQAAAKSLDFETAAQIKQQIGNLNYLASQSIAPDDYLQNPELMADKRQQGLDELAEVLEQYFSQLAVSREPSAEMFSSANDPSLTHSLHRIECYDISNTMGQQAVGSMVVFIEGQASKSHYRKFRIKQDNTPNDPAMIKEILRRRLKKISPQVTSSSDKSKTSESRPVRQPVGIQNPESTPDQSFTHLPNLLIIDGGKAQLNAAEQVLADLNLQIPIISLTKRDEELLLKTTPIPNPPNPSTPLNPPITHSSHSTPSTRPNRSAAHAAIAKTTQDERTQITTESNYTTIRLARGSEALFLIQRLRDEAHRFAIQYHKQLRQKAFLPNKDS